MADINQELQQMTQNVGKLNDELGELVKLMKDRVAGESKMLQTTKGLQDQLDDIELDEYAESLTKGRKLNDEQNKSLQQALSLRKKEIEIQRAINKNNETIQSLQKAGATNTQKYQDLLKANAGLEKQKTKVSLDGVKAAKGVGGSFTSLVGKANILGAAITWLIGVLVGEAKRQFDLMEAYSGVVEGTDWFAGQMRDRALALEKAVDPVAFAKLSAANRQMINAMGGTANAMKSVDSVFMDFAAMTGGNWEAALQLSMEQMRNFATLGVKPTQQAMVDYKNDVMMLAKQTGMAPAQIQAFYDEIARDTDSMVLLRAAREDEREAILKSQRAMVQQAIAAGMTAEQAKEAAKMLNKMVAAKPIDRMKQAAKMRALGGALGIAGADDAAKALIAGPRASAEQRQALMEFSQNASNMIDSMRGAGLGQEIFATALLEKLDLEQYFGAQGTFSTRLGDTLAKPIEDLNKTMATVMGSDVAKTMLEVKKGVDQAAQVLSGAGLVGLFSKMSEYLGKIWEWTGKAAELIWEKMKQGFDALAGWISKLGELISGIFGGAWNFVKSAVGLGPEEKAPAATAAVPTTGEKTADTVNKEKTMVATQKAAEVQEKTSTTAIRMSDGIMQQLTKMDEGNVLLKKIADTSEKQLDLAEKQLAATLMSEKEKGTSGARRGYLEGMRFTNFGYVPQ